MPQNILDLEYREQVLNEILGAQNLIRKAQSYKNSEVYNQRAAPYIEQRLLAEFPASAKTMRKILSINPAKRITDNKASIYNNEPDRTPVIEDGGDLSEDQIDFIEDTYLEGKYNSAFQQANRILKYQHQCAIQIVPLRGVLAPRVLQPHQYDVIPQDNDPESAYCYIISAFDRSLAIGAQGNGIDGKIADVSDGTKKERQNMRFVWWSPEYNFITDGAGKIVSGDQVINPLGELPFIDVHDDKENEFFVRKGSPAVDFTIDLAVVLSDTANINRLQGYAQMVLISEEEPGEMRFGPEQAIHLKPKPQGEAQPDVKFISANANLDASLKLIGDLISLFMTSDGQDPKIINTSGTAQQYKSGLERFLAQVERFDASRSDFDKFRWVESEAFRLICAWANLLQGATNTPLTKVPSVSMPDDCYLQVQFDEPQLFTTRTEQEASEFAAVDRGVSSLVMAVQNLFDLDEASAIERIKKVREQQALYAPKVQLNSPTAPQTVEGKKELAAANQEPVIAADQGQAN